MRLMLFSINGNGVTRSLFKRDINFLKIDILFLAKGQPTKPCRWWRTSSGGALEKEMEDRLQSFTSALFPSALPWYTIRLHPRFKNIQRTTAAFPSSFRFIANLARRLPSLLISTPPDEIRPFQEGTLRWILVYRVSMPATSFKFNVPIERIASIL